MNIYSRKLLVLSVIVAWICVFFKYESMALLSRSSSSGGSRSSSSGSRSSGSLRQTIRNAYHRVVDSKPKSTNTESSSHRVRQTIRDGYHKITDNLPGRSHSGSNTLGKKLLAAGIFSSLTRKISHTPGGHHSHMYQTGYYNGYNYRPNQYATITGSLCTNSIPYESGIALGQFYCPIEGFAYDDTYCCGPSGEQYCCNHREYRTMYGSSSTSQAYLFFFLILPMLFLLMLVVCFVFCILKFKVHKKLFSKSESTSKTEEAVKEESEALKTEEPVENVENKPDESSQA